MRVLVAAVALVAAVFVGRTVDPEPSATATWQVLHTQFERGWIEYTVQPRPDVYAYVDVRMGEPTELDRWAAAQSPPVRLAIVDGGRHANNSKAAWTGRATLMHRLSDADPVHPSPVVLVYIDRHSERTLWIDAFGANGTWGRDVSRFRSAWRSHGGPDAGTVSRQITALDAALRASPLGAPPAPAAPPAPDPALAIWWLMAVAAAPLVMGASLWPLAVLVRRRRARARILRELLQAALPRDVIDLESEETGFEAAVAELQAALEHPLGLSVRATGTLDERIVALERGWRAPANTASQPAPNLATRPAPIEPVP